MTGVTAAEGYTLVLCGVPICRAGPPFGLSAALRECVRSSRYGVLVMSGCTLGPVGCRLREAGPIIVVQPCDTERRPTRPAVRIGPIRDDGDLAAVRNWIRCASFDPSLLPTHLTALHRARGAAARN